MFGVLKPSGCDLSATDRLAWRRAYCGTCKALGDGYGLVSRATLSFDTAMFALMVEGQTPPIPPGTGTDGDETNAESSSCRCPVMPLMFRPIVAPERPSVRAAAALQMALTDQWLTDHALDGRTMVGTLTRWSRPKSRRALQNLETLGFDPEQLRDLASRQAAIEEAGHTSPAAAAAPTAKMLESAFGQIPQLAGQSPGALTEPFRQLGHAVGTAIYLLDAIEDLPRDASDGNFNPCLDDSGQASQARLDAVVGLLSETLEEIGTVADAIEWLRHGVVIKSALVDQLRARATKAVDAAWEWVDANCPAQRSTWHKVLLWLMAPLLWVTRPLLMGTWGPSGGGSGGNTGRGGSNGPPRSSRKKTPSSRKSSGDNGCCSCCSSRCCGTIDCCDAIVCCECITCCAD